MINDDQPHQTKPLSEMALAVGCILLLLAGLWALGQDPQETTEQQTKFEQRKEKRKEYLECTKHASRETCHVLQQ